MNIVVLCGGMSMERDVSLSSGALICRALRAKGHAAVLADLYMGVEAEGDLAALFTDLPPIPATKVPRGAPDLEKVRASRPWKSPSLIGKNILELCRLADVVFLGLHGTCGEDGRIQAVLDLLGVPYTGSGCLGSALAMDKHLTKQIVAAEGVHTPAWKFVRYEVSDIDDIVAGTKLPCVVKPLNSGSSVGVSIPETPETLKAALLENLHRGEVLIEEYITGREIDVGVLDDRALPSIEITPKQGFYYYENKYQPGATVEVSPAPIDPATERKLGEAALIAHRKLGLTGYSRSDFILDDAGTIWFLEINTLPGMTPTSLLPQEAAAAGIRYEELCQKIVELGLKRKRL